MVCGACPKKEVATNFVDRGSIMNVNYPRNGEF